MSAPEILERTEVMDDLDNEIKEAAKEFVEQTDSFSKAVELLRAEYVMELDDAQNVVGQALEDSRWKEKEYSEQMQESAAKARDKELEARAENDRLYIENHGHKIKKRLKVSPEDEAKFAKLIRKQVEQAQKALGPSTRLTRMDTVKKKKLYWLWQHRVPLAR